MTGRRTRLVAAGAAVAAAMAALTGCSAADSVVGVQKPPPATTTAAAVTGEQAGEIAQRTFTAAAQAMTASAGRAAAARKVAYGGPALRAATADAELADVSPGVRPAPPAVAPGDVTVLAVSRGVDFPRAMVAQTVPAAGSAPVLHLLTSERATAPYRITSSAQMLPDATIEPFAPVATGSPLLEGKGDLAVAPADLLASYARSLSFPGTPVSNPAYTPDRFADQVRSKAAAQARTVEPYARFHQSHQVLEGSTVAIAQAGGGALAFGVLERTDTFDVRSGQKLTPPKAFTELAPRQQSIAHRASMTSLEFVVFAVPAGSGKARLVAVSDHLVAAKGS